jgi:DNA-directed RNA polymerase specialized sigma24 family protein
MEIKAELNSMRYLTQAVASKNRQIDELEDLKVCISSPRITGMPKAKSFERSEKIEKILDKITKLEDEKRKEIDSLLDKRVIWTKRFRHLPTEQVSVMEMRYFENYTWEEIAKKMNYERRTIFRIHGQALEALKIQKTAELVTKSH